MSYDSRYEWVRCPRCGGRWQLIEWRGATHQLRCAVPEVPKADRDRISAAAAAGGVAIRWEADTWTRST